MWFEIPASIVRTTANYLAKGYPTWHCPVGVGLQLPSPLFPMLARADGSSVLLYLSPSTELQPNLGGIQTPKVLPSLPLHPWTNYLVQVVVYYGQSSLCEAALSFPSCDCSSQEGPQWETLGFSLSASYMWDGSKRKFLKGLFCLLATSSSVQVHTGFSKWMLICLNNWQFCGKGQVESQVQKAKTADGGNKQHKQNWQYCKCMAKSLTLKSHWCNLLILILHRKLWLVPYIIRQQTWTGHQIGHTWQAAISLSFLISAPLRSLCFQSCEWDMLLLHSCFSFHTKTS